MLFRHSPRLAGLLLGGVVVLVATGLVAQGGPRTNDAKTAEMVARMVEKLHVSQKKLNDATSEALFKKYLSDLDPMKLYFLQSDIDQLARYRTKLDDLVLEGNTDFAYVAFDMYLKRLSERLAMAQRLIDSDFDFTIDESISTETKDLPWAKTEAEINERWRKRIKYDVLSLKLDAAAEDAKAKDAAAKPPQTDAEKMMQIRERLHKRYHNVEVIARQTDDSEKLELYLSALTHTFDPHSAYMSPNTLEDFRISMELSLEGIGAALRTEDGYVTVAEVVPGGAAEKDGRLKAGDKIIGVAQQGETEFTDTVEMKLTHVVRLIRGNAGTGVRLQVKTAEGDIKVYDLTRQKIELKSSAVRGEIIDTGERIGDRSYRVGVVHIPSFYRDFRGAQSGTEDFKSTSRDVLAVLKDFRTKGGVDGIVVDLRYNGGGALAEAIEVTGLFIDKGPIVQVKEPDGNIRTHDDVDPAVYYNGPLVVLCNRLSASASEIFAGAIKDYGRGIVIGDTTTHGKGTVQNVMDVPPRFLAFLNTDDKPAALKLTIQQFYRVNGDSTQNIGVPSDVILPSMFDHLDLGEQFLDNALPFSRIKPAAFRAVAGLVESGQTRTLRERSAARVAADPEFLKLQKEIVRFIDRKADKSISLNEQTRLAERAEAQDKEAQEEKIAEEVNGSSGPIFPANEYNNEVLQITADYIELLKGAKTVKR